MINSLIVKDKSVCLTPNLHGSDLSVPPVEGLVFSPPLMERGPLYSCIIFPYIHTVHSPPAFSLAVLNDQDLYIPYPRTTPPAMTLSWSFCPFLQIFIVLKARTQDAQAVRRHRLYPRNDISPPSCCPGFITALLKELLPTAALCPPKLLLGFCTTATCKYVRSFTFVCRY